MNELQDQLIAELDELIKLLTSCEERTWVSFFKRVRHLIDHGDTRGIEAIRRMKGGMGSFNDLVICQINGHKIRKDQEDTVNIELSRLGSLVYNTANNLHIVLSK